MDTSSGEVSPALFRQIPPDVRNRILSAARPAHRATGQFFFRQADQGSEYFLLTKGHVRLTHLTVAGAELTIRVLGPGEPFGAIDGVGMPRYAASAEAAEPSAALCWDASTIRTLLSENGTLALNALDVVVRRLLELQQRYGQLAFEPVQRRIARALLRLAHAAGHAAGTEIEIDFPISRQDIAEMACTSLYTVSRVLSQWQDAGVIRGGRRRIVLIKPPALVKIASEEAP